MLNPWGWFFFLLSFVAFMLLLKKQQRVMPILLCGFAVIFSHHILSFLNVVYGPFSFAEYDARSFHEYTWYRVNSLERLNWAIGADLYKSALTVMYKYLGISLWLGQSVSILFFSFSCACLVRITHYFKLNSIFICIALLIFGLLPSSMMFGCFTLRETYMTCFFMCGVVCGYHAIERSRYDSLLLSAACLLLVGVLHQIMLIYAVGLILVLFIWFFIATRSAVINIKVFVGILLTVVVVIVLAALFLPVSIGDNYFAMLDIRLEGRQLSVPEAVNLYRESINQTQASTMYAADLFFSSWLGMLKAFLVSYVFYLGWPFTGNYLEISTWVIFSEAIFRILAFISLLFIWRDKRIYWFLFIYFSMTMIWNIGTTNHGQALRHHSMSEWILLLFILLFAQQLMQKRLNAKR